MSKEEKEWFDKLYEYIRKEIFFYDTNQSLPRQFVLRLKGMSEGKVMANRNQKAKANYSYELILYTFQICRSQILKAISFKSFKSEMQKFIYICAIVENNLNDTYERMKRVNKTKEKSMSTNMNNVYNKGAAYQQKTKDVNNQRLNKLW